MIDEILITNHNIANNKQNIVIEFFNYIQSLQWFTEFAC